MPPPAADHVINDIKEVTSNLTVLRMRNYQEKDSACFFLLDR